ncbi:hypothetical protein [Mesorhizobium sp. BR1-1-4]|uniref:hypothetical protein n=1 Tax=Mesorhizobium sp. BR1-1-4 TaxID=2876650 RepID=UPI001CC94F00|nr:hypothetical protein [Mesorhizobium sp. BR1-1-4]MBZ9926801.1 hypothetical protein [Mesorhizobium sp. BR1-1-4]
MDTADQERLAAAFATMATNVNLRLANKPVPGNAGTSDPILGLIHEFASEGKVRAMGEAFHEFKRRHSSNASFVAPKILGMITEYWRRQSALPSAEKTKHLALWESLHPDWAAELAHALQTPSAFEATVEQMLREQNGLIGGPVPVMAGYADVDRNAFAKLYLGSGDQLSGSEEQEFETAFDACAAAIAAQDEGKYQKVRVWVEDAGFIDFPLIGDYYTYWVANPEP